MATPTTQTELLKVQREELIKSYTALDAYDRPEYVYTARTDAANGDSCTRVQYVYASSTSAVVIKMKETYSLWVSATMDV